MRILKKKEQNLLLHLTYQNPKTHFGPKRTLGASIFGVREILRSWAKEFLILNHEPLVVFNILQIQVLYLSVKYNKRFKKKR